MQYSVREISFEQIFDIWSIFLWPNRQSRIDTHSSIVFGNIPYIYDMSYFQSTPVFIGAFNNDNILLGVDSGHNAGQSMFRSRGLYVFPDYRGNGIGVALLEYIKQYGYKNNAFMCWSIPRLVSKNTYLNAGFIPHGDVFETETSKNNIFMHTDMINSISVSRLI